MHYDEQPISIVANNPVGIHAINFMSGLAQTGTLSERTRLRIAIYMTSLGHSVFPLAMLHQRGRSAGMNGAEMNANQQGTSHDAMDTACLQFVKATADNPAAPTPRDLEGMYAVGYTLSDILEVMAQVYAHPAAGLAHMFLSTNYLFTCVFQI